MHGEILSLCLLQTVLLAVAYSQPAVLSDFAAARQRMVEEQLSAPGRDIKNRLVLEAMATVPRHEFVPESLRKFAYSDEPLPIGYGQTISQPFIVAFMTEQLNPKPTDRVLEIGTGSGYQAAILSRLVAEVYTIEIIEPLAKRAEADLRRLGFLNVKVLAGDGYKGWPEYAPFDSVIVTCAPVPYSPGSHRSVARGRPDDHPGRCSRRSATLPVAKAWGEDRATSCVAGLFRADDQEARSRRQTLIAG